jgi:multidrug efflux pump subunit AcrA (membrane-fusion protein)
MLLRISLIIAILAGLGAGGMAYYEFSTQIPALTTQRDKEKQDKDKALADLASTRNTLKKTQGELAQTQQQLADTKADLAKTTARAEAQEKRANDLSDKLTKATAERDQAQGELAAYKASGLTADQVVKLDKSLRDATARIDVIKGEMAVLNREYLATKARLSKYEGPDNFIRLPADLKGKVVDVDPKWDFVVLNIGGEQGAIQDGEMLVSRDGRLVAKVVITRVEKNTCIANVVPGWKLGQLIEGDVVTPAHPASS